MGVNPLLPNESCLFWEWHPNFCDGPWMTYNITWTTHTTWLMVSTKNKWHLELLHMSPVYCSLPNWDQNRKQNSRWHGQGVDWYRDGWEQHIRTEIVGENQFLNSLWIKSRMTTASCWVERPLRNGRSIYPRCWVMEYAWCMHALAPPERRALTLWHQPSALQIVQSQQCTHMALGRFDWPANTVVAWVMLFPWFMWWACHFSEHVTCQGLS